jgi:tetratricopeptide (TPR) repeat protein
MRAEAQLAALEHARDNYYPADVAEKDAKLRAAAAAVIAALPTFFPASSADGGGGGGGGAGDDHCHGASSGGGADDGGGGGEGGDGADGSCVAWRARRLALRGRALEASSGAVPDAEAEALLSRALKLDPEAGGCGAWNALGHSYWKAGELAQARSCFEGALELEPNAESLRHLSMLLRSLPPAPGGGGGGGGNQGGGGGGGGVDHAGSLRRAEEAVALGLSDARNWYALGNAHWKRGDHAKSVAAYRRAVALAAAHNAKAKAAAAAVAGGDGTAAEAASQLPLPLVLPDLHFNLAQVLSHRQRFGEAARHFALAEAADPTLPAAEATEAMAAQLRWCAAMVGRRGGAKPKRLAALSASVAAAAAAGGKAAGGTLAEARGALGAAAAAALGDAALGAGGAALGKEQAASLRRGGGGCRVALKLLMPGRSATPPYCMLVIDGAGECAILALYSVAAAACARWTDATTFSVALGCSPPPDHGGGGGGSGDGGEATAEGGGEAAAGEWLGITDIREPLPGGGAEFAYPLLLVEDAAARLAVNGAPVPQADLVLVGTGAAVQAS